MAGVVIGMVGGFVLGKMKLESSIDKSLQKIIAKRLVTQSAIRKHDTFFRSCISF
jgi:hypothetical protein